MVFILDGFTFHYAHILSNIEHRHLVTSKESSNPELFFGKDLFYIIQAQHVLSYHPIYIPWWKGDKLGNGYTVLY